jgi:hypothetical protein
MAIKFSNRNRSYDATRHLRSDAVDLLRAFDINRDRIYAIAAKVYARGRRGSYDLNVADV